MDVRVARARLASVVEAGANAIYWDAARQVMSSSELRWLTEQITLIKPYLT